MRYWVGFDDVAKAFHHYWVRSWTTRAMRGPLPTGRGHGRGVGGPLLADRPPRRPAHDGDRSPRRRRWRRSGHAFGSGLARTGRTCFPRPRHGRQSSPRRRLPGRGQEPIPRTRGSSSPSSFGSAGGRCPRCVFATPPHKSCGCWSDTAGTSSKSSRSDASSSPGSQGTPFGGVPGP